MSRRKTDRTWRNGRLGRLIGGDVSGWAQPENEIGAQLSTWDAPDPNRQQPDELVTAVEEKLGKKGVIMRGI
ncbi:MAG TPA: hypothetical protein VIO61_06285 [Anaerolineaceae bacterium]